MNHIQSVCTFFGPKCVLVAKILKWEDEMKIEISTLSGTVVVQEH